MIKPHTLKYYNWYDIQDYICKEIGIKNQFFREYNKVVGGPYKDLWHLWLDFVNFNVHNGSYIPVYFEGLAEYGEQLVQEKGYWVKPFLTALNKLADELDENELVIYYAW